MDYITINSIKVPIEGEKNVLSLIRKAGIDILLSFRIIHLWRMSYVRGRR